jgi:hypothetical protein
MYVLQVKFGQLQTTVVGRIPHCKLSSSTLSSWTEISLTHETLESESTHSILAMGGARIRDLVPDQRRGAAQQPPILSSLVVYAHELSFNSTFAGHVAGASL